MQLVAVRAKTKVSASRGRPLVCVFGGSRLGKIHASVTLRPRRWCPTDDQTASLVAGEGVLSRQLRLENSFDMEPLTDALRVMLSTLV